MNKSRSYEVGKDRAHSSNNHYNESKIFTPVRDYSRNHITPTKQTPQGRMNENFIK